ncbi:MULTISPECIES: hypothetical protein [Paenibacillus]|nr:MULTISPECIES: hypothetical protein [Paenibacillus]AIW39970.1 hypothetical protein X809_28100 [Paenibacillus polymyxa CR1]APQ59464.1 hypothetical protein VK72_12345 [Paenibacillus polymyxa]MCP3747663.1 hypothetical protein [Paenibacillus sp. A3M_27_13]
MMIRQKQKKIQQMASFTPQKVVLLGFDKPNSENKQIQKYVDEFVGKLRFQTADLISSDQRFF